MKCTNKKRIKLLCVFCTIALFVAGCGAETEISHSYEVYQTDLYRSADSGNTPFAQDLCVTDTQNFGLENTNSEVAEGAGVFNLTTAEVLYNKNIFERLYPASTTKILTAYIILNNCDVNDSVTVSEEAATQASDSSVCGLSQGDVISVQDLLYGLMLASGNDAAIALAEHYSGSVEAFADVMNQTAKKLGATNSHFMNPHGLPDENHYTTVYDMYLIFQKALEIPAFVELICTSDVTASFLNKNGNVVEKQWTNTNKYVNRQVEAPEGITVVGGKTGTTGAAGYCLVLYSKNERNEDIVSIVYKADGRSNLYLLMNQILQTAK